MNPTAVNQTGGQVPGGGDTPRSVFGAPLPPQAAPGQPPVPLAPVGPAGYAAGGQVPAAPTAPRPAEAPRQPQTNSRSDAFNTTSTHAAHTLETTDKEWAESAHNVVMSTTNNPYDKSQKIAALRTQYLALKYGKKPEPNEPKS